MKKGKILRSVFGRMGLNQFTRKEAPDIPRCVYEESYTKELDANWKGMRKMLENGMYLVEQMS